MRKKGQITVFIIIGIIMLLAVMFFFYMRADITKITYTEKVPEEFIPLSRFVESCMEKTTRETAQLAGQQGGYVEVPPLIKRNPFSRIKEVPQLDMVVPYWYYRRGGSIEDGDLSPYLCKSREQCEYDGPNSIQEQMETRIQAEMVECIDSFNSFEKIYEILENGSLEIRISLNDDSIVTLVDFPIKVKDNTGQIVDIKRFRTEIPVRLRRLYELAKELFEKENEQKFLEDVTIDLMAMASKAEDTDNLPLVPMSDMIFGQCKSFMKSTAKVKENIQNFLPFNLDSIRINETKQERFNHTDYRYANNHFVWKTGIDENKYSDLRVTMDYNPDWGMKLRVIPSQNNYLKAEPVKLLDVDLKVTKISIPACFINYHFVYDIEYPIIINILDDEIPGQHEASMFRFVMPVIINHNEGDRVTSPIKIMPDRLVQGGEYQYCEQEIDKISITAMDEITYEPINDVDVKFSCIEFTCDMGKTRPARTTYSLETMFPECNYGTITLEREGYFTKEIKGIDTKVDTTIDAYMLKKKTLNLTVQKYLKGDTMRRMLMEDEVAIIDIKNTEYNYQTTGFYSTDTNLNQIELPLGENLEFEIDVLFMKNDSLIGGNRFNWTADAIELANANEIKIPVAVNESAIGDFEAQINIINDLAEFSKGLGEPELE